MCLCERDLNFQLLIFIVKIERRSLGKFLRSYGLFIIRLYLKRRKMPLT